jgi:hypothetical protein
MAKRRISSCSRSDEITAHGYRVLTSTQCTIIMIAELAVRSGLGSFLDSREWFGNGYGLDMVLDREDFWDSFAKLWDL